MGTQDTPKNPFGNISRRRFQGLAAAGILSVGLGIGAVSGAFASTTPQSLMASSTPVATASATSATNPPNGPGRRGHGPGGFLGPIATFLGMSQSDLQSAVATQTLAQVAVAHGKSAADLKAFLLNQDSARIDQLINSKLPQPGPHGPGGPGGPGGRGGPGGPGGFFGADIPTFLGMSRTDFRAAVQGGQTPAQIAVAHGKTAAELTTYLTGQLKTRLDAAVASGKITSQQETDQLAQASSHLAQFINSSGPPAGMGSGSPPPTPPA